ncbi:hypothetical protein MAP00_007047 [Monascus purpureus]|nr:hypothetical protein MAP00_007047 [Monascus purpureus]
MFARLDCFEAVLYNSFSDEPRRKLSIMLRLWVNMLRSGKLIAKDITKHLQDALAECGWEDAAKIRQQDVSEAFTFITEKLELPLLTLKMDIYHTGKEDATDDHKFVNERLLEVAIPPDSDEGKSVTLEDCLESYFNNKIEVKRYLERSNTTGSTRSVDSIAKGWITHIETVEVDPETSSPITPTSPWEPTNPLSSITDLGGSSISQHSSRRRSSIIQQRFIPDPDDSSHEPHFTAPYTRPRKGSYRKEVMMPAWQFFSLIPWYTDNTQTDDAQVASHFSSKRPIVGLCLKRYTMTPTGEVKRLSTHVDIPTEIGLPHFIQDDNMDSDGSIYGNFKLSLQAFVCHRGNSVNSGHYIAIVRGTNAGATPADRSSSSQSTDDPSRYWMRFDDLAEERVTLVDVEKALESESPYLLFYQILPIDEDAAEANLRFTNTSSLSSASVPELDVTEVSESLRNSSTSTQGAERVEGFASMRPSLEITAPETPVADERRNSTLSDSAETPTVNGNLRVNPASSSTRDDGLKGEGTRRSLSFSRRGSRVSRRSNPSSRDGSQTGDNRLSIALSNLRLYTKDKMNDELSIEENGEKCATPITTVKSSPPGGEIRDRSTARKCSKDRGRSRYRQKERSRNKMGRKPDRECMVM